MGHMYPKKECEAFLKRLYAKGALSMRDMCEYFLKHNFMVSCAGSRGKGGEEDYYIYEMAMMAIVDWLRKPWVECRGVQIVTKEMTPPQSRALDAWLVYDTIDWDSEKDMEDLFSIKWKYAPTWRKKYKEIPVLTHYET